MKNFVRLFSLVSMLLLSQLASTQLSYAQESLFDTSSSSLFSNDDEFLTVEEAFVFDFFQKRDKLEVTFNIQEGYYLYRHQFKISAENADITPVELPAGIEHEDEFFGVQQIFKDSLEFVVDINQADANGVISIRYQGCAEKGLCYPPTTKKIDLSAVTASSDAVLNALAGEQTSTQLSATKTTDSQTTDAKVATGGESSEQFKLADMLASGNVWITLIAFFGGGLLLSFTPCVFPMYPILTGIIVGQGDNLSTKRAFSLSFFYVQGMAITYTLLGVVVALAGAQFQAMFQHPAVLIALSILFIFLALSMFGVFNLALPSSWQNKLNNLSNQQKSGSYKGVVAMGAISGLVASPCTTAPLTGALIYISQSGDIVLGASALYALSLGMGLPLLVLGSSGGKILPKAGNWMTVIKNIFGFLLLAVPVFLIERFIPATAANVLWALLILSTATYFYVANSDSTKNFWFGLRSMIIFVMMFFGANLLYQTLFPSAGSHQAATESHEQHFSKVANLAELQAAVKEANANGKTVMLDLYADWCIACKEFEKYTFPTPQVQQALANSVLIQIDLTDTGSESSVELMGHFEVFGLPSILFFDLNGNELDLKRVTGFMGADEFAAHVNSTFN